MRYVCLAAVAVLSVLAPSSAFGQLSITNYQFVSQQSATPTKSDFTYRADLVNAGGPLGSVTATLTSADPFTVRTVPGQDTLQFAPVPANSQVTSSNTFTILADNTFQFDPSKLQWSFQTTAAGPIANAGPNQSVKLGSTVTLDGSASSNPSGAGTLSYSWAMTFRPPGTSAVLRNASTVMPTFVADVIDTYVITLTVSNGVASSSASVMVTTVPGGTPPVANAGPNQTVAVGSTVVLNGSGSTSSSGNPLTYAWTLSSRPAGSTATLTGANTVSPTFVADKAGTYMAQLIVNDGLSSAPSTVTISTSCVKPVANAGPNQVLNTVGALVQLNGAGSTDACGLPLTYQWSLITLPAGSVATLSNPAVVNPTFIADRAGSYVAQLIVNNGTLNSDPATVTITDQPTLAPTANAGPNQTVNVGSMVQLNGSGTDPQNLPLTFQWSLLSKPAGSAAVLTSANIANPTFIADLAGTYIAQLVVNNGTLSSAPSTVTISTTCSQPTANPGPSQNVLVGATVTLNGSASGDACHDPLTYAWSFTTRPAGSTATLSGATTVSPTFVADVAGTYVVQLIVNNGFTSSNPATVTVTAASNTGGGDIILPANVSLQPGDTVVFPVTLANPAPSGGLFISLASSDTSKLTISPTTVFIAQGAMVSNPKITGVAVGSATITASASGLQPASQAVQVGTGPTLSFQPPNLTITASATQNLTLVLSAPAQANLTVNLSSSNTGVATVPGSVNFAVGATSVQVPVTGVAIGSATITASATGLPSATANVTVQAPQSIGVPANTAVALGCQSATFAVTLPQPAPVGGVTVNLTSSDTTKVTVSPSSVFIAAGATTPATQAQVTGAGIGSATVTASATGYTSSSGTVTVSGAPMSFTGSPLSINVGNTGNLTLNMPGCQAPAGGLTVNLSSSNTGVATVQATVSFAAGTTSVPVPVTGVATGSATITASATGIASATATVNVGTGPVISVPANTTVALGQSAAFAVTLSQAAPAAGLTVNLTSSDTSKVTVTSSVFVPNGATTPTTQPQVTGAGIGSATVTASATGYASGNGTVTVSAPTMSFTGSPLSINVGASGSLTLNLTPPAPAGGLTVNLSSSDTSKATVPATVSFGPGATSVPVPVTGVASGSATITASAAGIANATATVNVNAVNLVINVPANTNIGLGLSAVFAVSLSQAAPAGGVTIALTSSDTTKVSVPASVFIAGGATTPSPQPQVTGAGIGSATVTASATGYTSGNGTVTVSTPTMSFTGSPLSITAGSTGSLILNLTGGQAPAGGLTVNLSSSDTSKVTVPGSVSFAAGATSATVTVTGVAVTSTSVTITASATGFASATASVTVSSSGGPLSLSFGGDLAISAGTQGNLTLNLLGGKAPAGGYLVSLITSNQNVAAPQGTVTIPAGASSVLVTVSGVAEGSAMITARIPSVPSIPVATANVTVGPMPSPLVLPIVVPTGVSVGQNLQTSITLSLLMYTSCSAQSQTCAPVGPGGALVVIDRFTGQPILSAATFPQAFLDVTVTSSDPSKMLVFTTGACGPPFSCGSQQITFKLKQNLNTVGVFLQGFASSGTVTLTASAPGFPNGQATITLTPSGFALAGPGGTPSFTTQAGAAPTALTVSPVRLDSSFRLAEAQALRAGYNDPLNGPFDDSQGSISCNALFTDPALIQQCEASAKYAFANLSGLFTTSVTVSSSNPAVGTVPAPVVFNGGDTSASALFTPSPTNTGSTTLTAVTPNLFNTPSAGNSVTAIVNPAGISCGTVTVGQRLETTANCSLQGGVPSAGLPVTISSSDSSRLLLSAIPVGGSVCTDAGSSSITVTTRSASLGGVTNYVIPAFCVYGLVSSGSANYSVSVPGYATGTGSVTLAPSGFVIAGPGGIGSPSFSPQSSTTAIAVSSALLDASLNFVAVQALAIGQSANVTVTSSNTAVGDVNPKTLTIAGGSSSNATTFTNGGSTGTTTLTVNTPAGFSTPALIPASAPAPTGVTVIIVPKSFALSCNNVTIGQNLEAACTVTIGQPAPAGGQPVTLTSTNSSLLLLSTTATGAGSGSIGVTIPAGSFSTTYFAQGLASSGSPTHTASATGFTGATAITPLAPSGVVIAGPFGLGQTFNATVSGGQVPVTVYMAVLNTNATSCIPQSAPCFLGTQALRGGVASVQVSLTSSNPSVGTIPSPVTIPAGSDNVVTQFKPLSSGSTTLFLTTPAGFTASANDTSVLAQVTP